MRPTDLKRSVSVPQPTAPPRAQTKRADKIYYGIHRYRSTARKQLGHADLNYILFYEWLQLIYNRE
jgi:hypothetical protein